MFLVIFNVTLITKYFIDLHIMKKTVVKYRGLVSTLLTCIYIFSVLLSGYFHTHSNNFSSTELSFKADSSAAKASSIAGADNCYTLHASQVLIGDLHQIFDFEITKSIFTKEYSFVQYFSYSKAVIRFFSLRAPPFFI